MRRSIRQNLEELASAREAVSRGCQPVFRPHGFDHGVRTNGGFDIRGARMDHMVTTGNEVQDGSAVQIASVSVSPVRIRTAWSRPYTKTLPSPIFPLFADEMIVSMTLST